MNKTENKIHILMLPSWYLPHGGHFCRNQAQALTENGVKVNILANVSISWIKYGKKIFKFRWLPYTSIEDGLVVERFFSRNIPYFKKPNGLLWSWQTLWLYDKYVKKHGKPDLIHVHSVLWGGYAAYLINKKRGVPYIITEHRGVFAESCEYARNEFVDWQTPYMEKAFSNAKAIIPVSTKLIPKIKSFLRTDVPIHQISNLVDTDFFYYKKRIVEEEIKLVAVNGFMFVKAYDILLPAFDLVCDKLSNLQLRIVGEDFIGPEFDKIWSKVKHKNKVTFAGELDMDGVRSELWKANIFVIPSRVESQSVSALEALSTGLPMICTTVIPTEMANEKTAIIAPIEDVNSLSVAIIEMTSKFQQFDGNSISNLISNLASKNAVSNKLIDLYSQLIRN
jgi:glycosyltransferase involved in cell wall biosynthesis